MTPGRENRDHNGSALHRIASNTGFLVCSRILNALFSFAYVAWAVHALGIGPFGILLLVTAFVTLVSDMSHLQSWQALLHFGAAPFACGDRPVFRSILALCIRADLLSALTGCLAGIAIVFVTGTAIMGWSDAVRLDGMWMMATVLVMNTGWSVGLIRLCNRFGLAALFDFAATCTRTAGYLVGYLLHLSLGYFLFAWFLHQLVLFVLTTGCGLVLYRRAMGPTLPLFRAVLAERGIAGFWGFTLRVSSNQILDAIFRQGGTLVIGAILGVREVAIYRVTKQICDGLAKPAQMMIPSLYPEFVRFRDNRDWTMLRHVIRRLALIIGGFSCLAVLVAVFGGRTIVSLMLHQTYPGELAIILLMVGSALMEICIVPLETLLTVLGRLASVLRYRMLTIAGYFPVLGGLLMTCGITGAALASLLCSAFILIACLGLVPRWIGTGGPVPDPGDPSPGGHG